jgi:hypothetical protein
MRATNSCPPAEDGEGRWVSLAIEALTASCLRHGRVVVSTLPNISRHACAAQILDLEDHPRAEFAGVRLVHVSADAAALWSEVDYSHAALTAEGYSLDSATSSCRDELTSAFGAPWRVTAGSRTGCSDWSTAAS